MSSATNKSLCQVFKAVDVFLAEILTTLYCSQSKAMDVEAGEGVVEKKVEIKLRLAEIIPKLSWIFLIFVVVEN